MSKGVQCTKRAVCIMPTGAIKRAVGCENRSTRQKRRTLTNKSKRARHAQNREARAERRRSARAFLLGTKGCSDTHRRKAPCERMERRRNPRNRASTNRSGQRLALKLQSRKHKVLPHGGSKSGAQIPAIGARSAQARTSRHESTHAKAAKRHGHDGRAGDDNCGG